MRGLLYKDAVTLMKQLKLFLMMILIFAVIPGYNLITFALVYCAMLPFSAMAYDERSKWNRLAAMLPYSDVQLVLCKYILGWLSVLSATLIAAVAQFAVLLIRGAQAELAAMLLTLVVSASASLILLALSLPFLYRFGVERGRMIFIVAIVLGVVGVTLFSNVISFDLNSAFSRWLILLVPALAVALNAISVPISTRLYQHHSVH